MPDEREEKHPVAVFSQRPVSADIRIRAFCEAVWCRPKRLLWAVRPLGQGTACADVEQRQRAKTHGAFPLMGVLLRDFPSSNAVVKIP